MVKITRSLSLFSLLLAMACGRPADVGVNLVSRAAVIEAKGEPLEEKDLPLDGGKMMIYPNEEKFQLKGDEVTHAFRQPEEKEQTLIYWQHKFKDCQTKTKKLPQDIKGHIPAEIEYSCPELNIRVIYTEGSGMVSRIIHEAE
jgi:hypothetical protein